MKKALLLGLIGGCTLSSAFAQPAATDSTKTTPDKEALRFNISADGKRFFQATFLNQTWLRFNESNDGTTVMGKSQDNTFDIGLRRTRLQFFGQITDRVFVYFQFGQNNFNALYNVGNNRKFAAFFHDAVCEYRVSPKNQLKLGAGLTIANGLSRFSQPSVSTIMTLDAPVFAQATVDQNDEFSRKLSVYARGQVGKFDYRFILSDPFPISSNGTTPPPISANAAFAPMGHTKQVQGQLLYQFFEHENNLTPYMTGTYLGKKKVFNVGGGAIYQPRATWRLENATDTVYDKMLLACVESYLDMPLNAERGTAISAYLGYFYYDYGKNYLRYNGLMNPANGTTATNAITGQGATFGNSYPMFGTGQSVYAQFGYLLPKTLLKTTQLMPYASVHAAKWERLGGLWTVVGNVGVNWLIKGHNAKVSLDYQNRPTYNLASDGTVESGKRKSCVTLQYQIFF